MCKHAYFAYTKTLQASLSTKISLLPFLHLPPHPFYPPSLPPSPTVPLPSLTHSPSTPPFFSPSLPPSFPPSLPPSFPPSLLPSLPPSSLPPFLSLPPSTSYPPFHPDFQRRTFCRTGCAAYSSLSALQSGKIISIDTDEWM